LKAECNSNCYILQYVPHTSDLLDFCPGAKHQPSNIRQ